MGTSHYVPVDVPTGWVCPRCQGIYAPLTTECWRCAPAPRLVPAADLPHPKPREDETRASFVTPRTALPPIGICELQNRLNEAAAGEIRERIVVLPFGAKVAGGDEPGASILRLPEQMAGPHYQRIAKVGRDKWTEVFPGLQCRVRRAIFACQPDGEPAGAELEFRLTPKDGQDHD